MGKILKKILGGEPIKADTAERYVKRFHETGSAKRKDIEAKNEDKVLNYLKSICRETDFPKGRFVNDIKKKAGRNG